MGVAPLITQPMVSRVIDHMANEGAIVDAKWARTLLEIALTTPDAGNKPTLYTPEIAAVVLDRLSSGESLREIQKDPAMPSDATFMGWVSTHGLSRQYAHARDKGIDVRFEQLEELADTATGENAQAIRLRVDTRKWMLSKLKPGKYGDKLDVSVTGQVNVTALSDDQLNMRVEARMRAKLEPVFLAIEHPTLEDVLQPFKVTPMPINLLTDNTDNG